MKCEGLMIESYSMAYFDNNYISEKTKQALHNRKMSRIHTTHYAFMVWGVSLQVILATGLIAHKFPCLVRVSSYGYTLVVLRVLCFV